MQGMKNPIQGMKNPILSTESSIEDLERVCAVLNKKEQPEVRPLLLGLVTAWERSGRNLLKMMKVAALDSLKEGKDPAEEFRTLYGKLMGSWELAWVPMESGGAYIWLVPFGRRLASGRIWLTPEDKAFQLFYLLTLGPHGLWEKFCDSPCARCGKYFIKKRSNHKVYCGRYCAHIATAKKSTRERLDREHKKNVTSVQAAIEKWDALKRRPVSGWKEWVSKKVPGITPKFLTRAVNKRELIPPSEGVTHATG
jgi:hypothetical protein